MQHARHRSPLSRRPVLAKSLLPALLLTAATGAFAGLAVVPTGPEDTAPDVLAFAEPFVPRPVDDLDKASRSRERRPSPSPSPKAVVKPSPKPAPPTPAPVKPTPKPRPKTTAKANVQTPEASSRIAGRCPVPSAEFTDTYGAPRSGGRRHKGTDMLASYGAPVYAAADGVVDTTSSGNGGISLYLKADNGERYFYAHNSENLTGDGERVEAGELIARVGSTGNAGNINHVHFEREVGGSSVNPYSFVRRLC